MNAMQRRAMQDAINAERTGATIDGESQRVLNEAATKFNARTVVGMSLNVLYWIAIGIVAGGSLSFLISLTPYWFLNLVIYYTLLAVCWVVAAIAEGFVVGAAMKGYDAIAPRLAPAATAAAATVTGWFSSAKARFA